MIGKIMNMNSTEVQKTSASTKTALPEGNASFEKNMRKAAEKTDEKTQDTRADKRADNTDRNEKPEQPDKPQDAAKDEKPGRDAAAERTEGKDAREEEIAEDIDAAAAAAALANMVVSELSAQQISGTGEEALIGAQENVQLIVPNSGAALQDEAAQAGAAFASDGEQVSAGQEQVDFIERVLGEINAVVSNEAERTDPAQQTNEAQDGLAFAQGYDIDKEKPLANGAAQLSQAAFQPGNAGAQSAEPDAVVTLPADAAAAQRAIADTLLEQVESAVTAEKSELYVKFKPDVFGGMQIHLSMTEDGLRAQIRTSDAAVRGMIGAELTQLTESLRAKGIDVAEMNVYYEQSTANNQFLDQRSNQWQEQQQGQNAQRTFRAEQLEESGYESMYERMIPVEEENAGVDYTA